MLGQTKSQANNSSVENIKSRNYMYQQQIDFLPDKIKDNLAEKLNSLQGIHQWAFIIHEKDTSKEGGLAKPHLHVMLRFKNPRSLVSVAEELKDSPEHVRKWNKNYQNGFSYLIHATNDSRHKHQYSADEVTANFDYIKLIKHISLEVAKKDSSNKLDKILDAIGKGDLTLKNAKRLLSGSEYASIAIKLDKAHSLYLERRAEQLHDEMVANNEIVQVCWLYGSTESGKTNLAEKIAGDYDGTYYKTTTKKDPFEFYQAEPIIILDELRPESIEYPELLAIFDPFSRGKSVISSRYHNKKLACRLFIVTTPLDPITFFHGYKDLEKADAGEQLYRRLSTVIQLDENNIYKMEYDSRCGKYIPKQRKENHYSKKNYKEIEKTDFFENI